MFKNQIAEPRKILLYVIPWRSILSYDFNKLTILDIHVHIIFLISMTTKYVMTNKSVCLSVGFLSPVRCFSQTELISWVYQLYAYTLYFETTENHAVHIYFCIHMHNIKTCVVENA